MKIFFQAIGLILFLFIKVNGQNFTASSSSTQVGEGEQFEVTFTFSGSDVNGISNFQAPNFKDFIVLSGPNQSTSMQIINGAVSGSRSFSYYLQAKSAGKYNIGNAAVNYKNQTIKSNSITIEVVKGTSKPKQQQEQNNSSVSTADIAENLFIRAVADKNTVYKGEQVTVTYKLYTRLNIASPQVSKLPSYQGFWAEELETSNNITFTRENYNGKLFNVGILKKAALFPTQVGELSVTPMELKIPVAIERKRKSRNMFDDFFDDPFFGRTETVQFDAKSNTLKVKVNPLPLDNIESFSGAVGNFNLTSSIDKNSVKQNEAVTLKINISGTGNIKLVEIPELKIPNGFEKYEPKINEDVNRSGLISGKKSFEYLIIPRVTGKYEIPIIKFSYFNVQKKSFINLSAGPFIINVEKGSGEYTGTNSSISKEEIKLLEQDIRFIKLDLGSIRKIGEHFYSSSAFISIIVFPLLAFLGLIIWKKREEKFSGNVQLIKNIKAKKVAKTRLKFAERFLKEQKAEEFYNEISQALFGYLEDKLNIDKADFTLDNAINLLTNKSISLVLINKIKTEVEKCEFIRFASSGNGIDEMQKNFNEASELIINLEEEFSSKKFN